MDDHDTTSLSSDFAIRAPACGLYRTGRALAGREEVVPAGRLVFFHNHSRQGPPLVLLPQGNEHNRWTFHERGYLVEDELFIENLKPLPTESFYVLEEDITTADRQTLQARALVQLGYTRDAAPVVFVARLDGATIRFPTTGYRIEERSLKLLRPCGFTVAPAVAREGVH